jgi:hypothetical protein
MNMQLCVIKILRRGKLNSRVQANNGDYFLVPSVPVHPYLGMKLHKDLKFDIDPVVEDVIRPLRKGDTFPTMLSYEEMVK